MNRRDFLGGTLVTAAALPAKAVQLSIDGGADGFHTTLERPSRTLSIAKVTVPTTQDILTSISREAVSVIRRQAASDVTFLARYDGLVSGGDTHYHNSGNVIRFDKHLVSLSESISVDLLSLDDAQIRTTFMGMVAELSRLFLKTSRGMTVQMARLPSPIPGTGAVAGCWNDGCVSVRAIASYDPGIFGSQFSIDVLYGHVEPA